VPLFFILVFALTWSSWLAAHFVPALKIPLLYLGIFAPAFVAIALTAWREKADGVVALLRRLFVANVSVRWYFFAFCYMAAIKLTAAVIHRAVLGAWPQFGGEPWFLMIAATILSVVTGGQTGEELGWRGYALPRLGARFGFAGASVILGVPGATDPRVLSTSRVAWLTAALLWLFAIVFVVRLKLYTPYKDLAIA
jgi:membrane protease YdiL (CAAX protease family)